MAYITDIKKLDFNGTYSYADYLTWRFKERVELIKGKIFKMSPAPTREHQAISRELSRIIANFFHRTKCELFTAPFDVRLTKINAKNVAIKTVVQPDLCVVCDAAKLDTAGCIGAPDLIVEILSPGNTKKEMGVKFNLYEENGVKEYWIVDPASKSVLVYCLVDGKYIGLKPFLEDDVLTGKLFTKLKVALAEVFS
jgi:Uma2 family endonuclease